MGVMVSHAKANARADLQMVALPFECGCKVARPLRRSCLILSLPSKHSWSSDVLDGATHNKTWKARGVHRAL